EEHILQLSLFYGTNLMYLRSFDSQAVTDLLNPDFDDCVLVHRPE
ncbi:hypothetical protein SAMN05443507_1602, partial [Alicyclobacillus tolerans]